MQGTASKTASGRLCRSRAARGGVVLLLAAIAPSPARAAFVPVFGAPAFVEGVGGYKSDVPNRTAINDSGTAVGQSVKFDGQNLQAGYPNVRWDATGAADELRSLGAGSNVSGDTIGIGPAINAAGVVVGSVSKYDANGTSLGYRAVRWDAAGNAFELEHLGTNASGVTSGRARSINAAGVAAGTIDKYDAGGTNKGGRGVRWDAAGAIHELASLSTKPDGFSNSLVYAMNANNVVVGYGIRYDATGAVKGTRAVRWDAAGAAQELSINFGANLSGVSQSRATALNDAGVAVGYAEKRSAGGGFQGDRAVRWDVAGTVLELGNLGTDSNGTTDSRANAINAAGIAVGYANKYDAAGNSKGQRAVKWDATGAVQELGIFGTNLAGITGGEANALNSTGIAVGYGKRYAADGSLIRGKTAVYWDPAGVANDLNDLIDPASGWTLSEANAITENGWIAGIGEFDPDGAGPAKVYTRLFSMQVPTAAAPEPGALGLVGIGVVTCLARRARRGY